MNKKRTLTAAAAVLLAASMLTACSGDEGGNPSGGNVGGNVVTSQTTPVPSTMAEEQQSQVEEIKVKDYELENKKITFLASWPRNPAKGKNKDVALELFQSRFGGEIEDITVPDADRYSRLATLISTGDAPDFFSAGDMDAFPKGAISKMFQPLDDYIDYDDEWWSDLSDLNEPFIFNGKHYVGAVGAEVDVLMIYNRAIVEENGLPDPIDLLAEDNWNWDTCKDMMNKFCAQGEGYYATDGWWVVKGFSATTGVPYVGMQDGKVVNNLRDGLLEQAQDFVYNIRKEEMAYPVWDYGWVANASNVGLGKTLFFPCGFWALTEVDTDYGLKNYGEVKDIGFVPMPKCPYVDDYYIPARVNGYMLVSGAPNPEGVACYLYCEAAAQGSEEAEQITKEQYFNEYGWTEDMWEMRQTLYDMLEEHPVFEFYTGISDELFDALDNPSKDSYHNAVSWIQTREEIFNSVQAEIDKANQVLE